MWVLTISKQQPLIIKKVTEGANLGDKLLTLPTLLTEFLERKL